MTELLSSSLASSVVLALLLGIKHGCDADHVAVVDGITRTRQLPGFWASRLVGAQFAAGHGAIILLASLLLHFYPISIPSWLDHVGLAISTAFLVLVGGRNLVHAVFVPRLNQTRTRRALGYFVGHQTHPALVGMAFAISFDAMTQALLFAGHGGRSGFIPVLALATSFAFGMVLMDAAAGSMLSWLGRRNAARANRVLSGFIAVVALTTATVRLFPQLSVCGHRTLDECGVWPGIFLIALTLAVCATSNVLLRRST